MSAFSDITIELEDILYKHFDKHEVEVSLTDFDFNDTTVELVFNLAFDTYNCGEYRETIKGNSIYDLTQDLICCYEDFDIDEYIAPWLEAKAKGDVFVPSVVELVSDGELIMDTLESLIFELNRMNPDDIKQFDSVAKMLADHENNMRKLHENSAR